MALAVAAVLLGCRLAVAAPSTLGPGRGAWTTATPESVGLDSAKLAAAATAMQQAAPVRYCFVVAKRGVIVHESYYYNDSATVYEADSLSKTAVAEVVGAAVAKGLIELDTPIKEYLPGPVCNRIYITDPGIAVAPMCALVFTAVCEVEPRSPQASTCDKGLRLCKHTLALAGLGIPRACRAKSVHFEGSLYGSDEDVYCMELNPGWCWVNETTGEDYFETVTTRHILSQSSGVGKVAPGTAFTYDSNIYISHLSYIIGQRANGTSAVRWATDNYAVPLGLPSLFEYDEFGPDFSAGGGQMMTCRDHLRVGQLLINKGIWLDGENNPYQMLTKEFAAQVLLPSYPKSAPSYGFLVWLNQPAGEAECCGPRWECPLGNDGSLPTGSRILDGGGEPQGAPTVLGLGIGAKAKFMYVIPESDTVVVSLGLTHGSSTTCYDGWSTFANGSSAATNGYDEGFSAALMWRAMKAAIAEPPPSQATPLVHNTTNTQPVSGNATTQPRPNAMPPPNPSQVESARTTALAVTPAKYRPATALLRRARPVRPGMGSNNSGAGGSCSCTCPHGMGFGFCFNLPVSTHPAGSCDAIYSKAQFCPVFGLPNQCHNPPISKDQNLTAVTVGGMNCVLDAPCQRSTVDPNSKILWANYLCTPREFERASGACAWTSGPCQFSPYFRPVPGGGAEAPPGGLPY